MQALDWLVLLGTLLGIVSYGAWKSREQQNLSTYLLGNQSMRWWAIGLSVMATQASAVTFLSTPGQGFDDGLRFIQFYFGMPLAVLVVAFVIIPVFYKQKVFTAYEYLEKAFGPKTRSFTALLFLIQRGLAAGITIFAPSIVLSTVLNIPLNITNLIIGLLVIIYTVSGGSKAVAQTQKLQMIVMFVGLFVAAGMLIYEINNRVPLQTAFHLADISGKFNTINWKFDLQDRYNIWSGILGGFFLSLSYFGTDQSQVGRYLGGKDVRNAKLGLIFNGIFKIPMQLFILFVGVLVFIFFQLQPVPLHFNEINTQWYESKAPADSLIFYKNQYQIITEEKQELISQITHQPPDKTWDIRWQEHIKAEAALRQDFRNSVDQLLPQAEPNDRDYIFLHYIMHHLPAGLVGLLLAMIFCAAMSSTSSELNALGSVTAVDFIYRHSTKKYTDHQQLKITRMATMVWGITAIIFATIFSLFDNLIQAVNILGSLFYGPILGIFLTAFFLPKRSDKAMLLAAIAGELLVLLLFLFDRNDIIQLAWLWLNPIGCLAVMGFSIITGKLFARKNEVTPNN